MGVIVLHTRFPGTFGLAADSIFRFVCPFLFAVTGRFLIPYEMTGTADIRKRVSKSLFKILRITAVVYAVYLIYSFVYSLVNGTGISEWFSSKFNPGEAMIFLLFNSGRFIYDESYVFDHMWYLFALIYVLALIVIFAPVLRKWYKALTCILLGLLFFCEILQNVYPIRPFDISINTWFMVRNWLFVGMPFVLLGIWFSDYVGSQKEKLGEKNYREKASKWLIPGSLLMILGMVFSTLEVIFLGKKECPFGALIMVIGILLLSESGISGGKDLWRIGKEASPNIYYYHVLVICLVDQTVNALYNNGINALLPMAVKPILIMILSLVLIWYIPYLIKKQKGNRL